MGAWEKLQKTIRSTIDRFSEPDQRKPRQRIVEWALKKLSWDRALFLKDVEDTIRTKAKDVGFNFDEREIQDISREVFDTLTQRAVHRASSQS